MYSGEANFLNLNITFLNFKSPYINLAYGSTGIISTHTNKEINLDNKIRTRKF